MHEASSTADIPVLIITHNEPITADLLAQRCDPSASFSCNPIFYLCCICHSEEREEKFCTIHTAALMLSTIFGTCAGHLQYPRRITHIIPNSYLGFLSGVCTM